MSEITRCARDASKKLAESRQTHADRFALFDGPVRLNRLERNLELIAAHLGVELLKPAPAFPLDMRGVAQEVARVAEQQRPTPMKRASTASRLNKHGPVGHI